MERLSAIVERPQRALLNFRTRFGSVFGYVGTAFCVKGRYLPGEMSYEGVR